MCVCVTELWAPIVEKGYAKWQQESVCARARERGSVCVFLSLSSGRPKKNSREGLCKVARELRAAGARERSLCPQGPDRRRLASAALR